MILRTLCVHLVHRSQDRRPRRCDDLWWHLTDRACIACGGFSSCAAQDSTFFGISCSKACTESSSPFRTRDSCDVAWYSSSSTIFHTCSTDSLVHSFAVEASWWRSHRFRTFRATFLDFWEIKRRFDSSMKKVEGKKLRTP